MQIKAGIISLGFSFLPELWMLATGGIPKLVLMVEFRAETQAEALEKAEALFTDLEKFNLHEKMHIAKNERAWRKYWVIRRESFNLLRKKIRNMRTAPFIDDFVVPPLSLRKSCQSSRKSSRTITSSTPSRATWGTATPISSRS